MDTHLGPHKFTHPMRDVGRHTDAIAMCYGALEDIDNFLVWIQKAAEARETEKPEQSLAFCKWMSNPAEFPVWGWRKTFCGGSDSRIRTMEVGENRDESIGGLVACVKLGMFDFV